MAAETSDVKPWTIRGIPPEERNAAVAAADRADMTLGEWLVRAIRTEIQQEKQASRAPVPVGQPVSDGQTSLADVERIAASVRGLAEAGVPISKTQASRIYGALLAKLPARGRSGGNGQIAPVSDETHSASDGDPSNGVARGQAAKLRPEDAAELAAQLEEEEGRIGPESGMPTG